MVREKSRACEENVSYAASMTQVILQRGFDPAEDAFPIYGPALSHISDSDLVLCDASGTVLRLYSRRRRRPGLRGQRDLL